MSRYGERAIAASSESGICSRGTDTKETAMAASGEVLGQLSESRRMSMVISSAPHSVALINALMRTAAM